MTADEQTAYVLRIKYRTSTNRTVTETVIIVASSLMQALSERQTVAEATGLDQDGGALLSYEVLMAGTGSNRFFTIDRH